MGKCRDAGLGTKTTESLMDWYEDEWINNFEFLPFDFKFEKRKEAVKTLGTVCISGKLTSFKTKAAATQALTAQGYAVKNTITKDVTILVNESGIESAKTKKARESGITIVTNLLDFIGDTNGNTA